jgi:peptidoglycan/LPS O-acetylase OafA/YrhL
MRFLDRFRRITTSGDFIPEIDGLRFLAIFLVILYHSQLLLFYKINNVFIDNFSDYTILYFFRNGFQGVELFFAISGFILGLPFANQKINKGKKVVLKKYYLRRLTRLEPPYIVAILLFFILLVINRGIYFPDLITRTLASVVYLHNIIFGYFPLVTPVAWSLEIEVQFYLLAPLLTEIYKLNKTLRRVVLFSAIILLPIIQWYFQIQTLSILKFLQYFLVGLTLADFYSEKNKKEINNPFYSLAGLILFIALLYFNIERSLFEAIIFPIMIFLFYYLVFHNPFWKKVFQYRILTTIGGMCYSIYLLHFSITSKVVDYFKYYQITDYSLPNVFVNSIICSIITLAVSAIFFLLIEKPCMYKDWPQKLKNRIKGMNPF